ncbi:protein of unknown function (DUF1206) [Brevibacterium aurantiacum]|uniref:DUF1206 domain-containing protein n=2 Tax=Brevibacterium aurantiacum TaxID=273384 RepID=A0A2H1HKQ6_BREAU|nr:protein of unknown function (DUF1206) [Brevibacterium aurantiacum]
MSFMDETDKLKSAADSADDAAQEAADSKWFERVARVGFVANGIVHIILGATAVAVGLGRGGEADQSGAVQQMAAQPFGMVLIVLCLIGCGLMALWCVFNAFFGSASLRGAGMNAPQHRQGRRRWVEFIKTIVSAVAYAAVALTFAQSVIGGGSDSGKTSSQASTTLAKAPGGLYILAAIGVVIVMIGIGFCIAGIRLKWMDELRMPRKAPVSTLLIATGIIGYLGKGATLLAVGALVVVSAMTGDPEEFTGIDGALKAMRDQPFGTVLMLAVGAGLVLYGVFLSLRARYDRMD